MKKSFKKPLIVSFEKGTSSFCEYNFARNFELAMLTVIWSSSVIK